jgi:hypothetical protein
MLRVVGNCIFKEWKCNVILCVYGNDRKALQLVGNGLDYKGEVIAVATVNLPDEFISNDNHVFIKDWSENEGILVCLQDSGIVGPVISEHVIGMVVCYKVELLIF